MQQTDQARSLRSPLSPHGTGQTTTRRTESPLDRAERHVRETEAHIVRQEQAIKDLESRNLFQPLTVMRATLAQMREMQKLHLQHLERERMRVGHPGPASPARTAARGP